MGHEGCRAYSAGLPSLSTSPPDSITASTATGGGTIISEGGAEIVVNGVCWNTTGDPTIEDSKAEGDPGMKVFSSNITGLLPNTEYHIRSFATNRVGTGYGEDLTFSTYAVMDTDGNGYYSVVIGDQVWISKNLLTTRYNDGDTIPDWKFATLDGYCCYNNDEVVLKRTYGVLYNWFAVNTGKLCPAGWHVPSIDEWYQLASSLDGESVAGGKLKETGTDHWQGPNTGAADTFGFKALPGGYCTGDGYFYSLGEQAIWWSSSRYLASGGYSAYIAYDDSTLNYIGHGRDWGFSVRCIKDN